MQSALRNGWRGPCSKGCEVSCADGRWRLERSPRNRVGAWKIRRRDAGRKRLRKSRADESELRQRPFHRRKNRHLPKLRRPIRIPSVANGPQRFSARQRNEQGGLTQLLINTSL